MKSTKQKTLLIANAGVPKSLVTLWAIVSELELPESPHVRMHIPDAVSELVTKIRMWAECDKARTPMNRSFATMRTRSPQKIEDVIQWLNQPDIVQILKESVSYRTIAELCKALNSIIAGEKAHTAFGQNKNSGRPTLPGFSRAQDAAFYAEYLTRIRGMAFSEATIVSAEIFEARQELVQAERAKLVAIDDISIKEMAPLSCSKYGITP